MQGSFSRLALLVVLFLGLLIVGEVSGQESGSSRENERVLHYLIDSGLKESAEVFQKETGTSLENEGGSRGSDQPQLGDCITNCDDCFNGQPLCRLARLPRPSKTYYLRGMMKSGTLWLDSIIHSILQRLADARGWHFQTDPKNRIHHLKEGHRIVLTYDAENKYRHKTRLNDGNNIVIVRDPRATVRSSHFFFANKELAMDSKIPVEEAKHKMNQVSVWSSVYSSELCAPNASYLQFHYERLKADPLPLLRLITDYLGYPNELTNRDLQDIVDMNSVSSLKQKEQSNMLVGGVQRAGSESRAHIREGAAAGTSSDWLMNYEADVLEEMEKRMCENPLGSYYLDNPCQKEGWCHAQRRKSDINEFYG